MQKITPKELAKRLQGVTSSTMATIELETIVVPLKNCKYPQLTKRQKIRAMIGADYERSVNNERCREDLPQDFIAEQHRWAGEMLSPALQTNKKGDQLYARLSNTETLSEHFYADGKEVPKEEIEEFLPKRSVKSQGVNKPVRWRNPKVFPECSITAINAQGERIEIIKDQ